jgi:hypothetical protein
LCRIGLDLQVPALLVMERKLGQADDYVPVAPSSVVLEPIYRSIDVLGAGGERLTDNCDVPMISAVGRLQVGHTVRDLGRGGWVSNKSYAKVSHIRPLPSRVRFKPPRAGSRLDMPASQIMYSGQLLTRTRTLFVG